MNGDRKQAVLTSTPLLRSAPPRHHHQPKDAHHTLPRVKVSPDHPATRRWLGSCPPAGAHDSSPPFLPHHSEDVALTVGRRYRSFARLVRAHLRHPLRACSVAAARSVHERPLRASLNQRLRSHYQPLRYCRRGGQKLKRGQIAVCPRARWPRKESRKGLCPA